MNIKILLVDPDEGVRKCLSSFFRIRGYHLQALDTAEKALIAMQRERYDIILCDYWLSGMNGLEFLKGIQSIYPNVIKTLMLSYKNEEVLTQAKRLGIKSFIEKPFTTETIEETIRRLVEK